MSTVHEQDNINSTKGQQKSPVITVDQALAELGGAVGRSTLYKALRNGVLPSRRLGRRILIPRQRFEAWLEG